MSAHEGFADLIGDFDRLLLWRGDEEPRLRRVPARIVAEFDL